MQPEEYIRYTDATYSEIAILCERAYSEVCRWFSQGKTARKPTARDLKILRLDYELKVERGQIQRISE